MLRWRTWLAPGIPFEFFAFVAECVSTAVSERWTLDADESVSGPPPGPDDPFARGAVDLGFLCTPSFRLLGAGTHPSVQLVGAAPVWADPRNGGRPEYFAELVVAAGSWSDASSLADLVGARFGMNDQASMSGWQALLTRADALGLGPDALGEPVTTGGHLRSLELLATGAIDAATIDSNTIVGLGGLPDGLRVVETLGPFPVQPVAAAATLDPSLVAAIRAALMALPERPLQKFGVTGFAPVSPSDYQPPPVRTPGS